jgi:hypothetical protein
MESNQAEMATIICAFITSAAAIISTIATLKKPSLKMGILTGVFLSILIVILIFLIFQKPMNPDITISYPNKGSTVEKIIDIRGKYRNISSFDNIVVFTHNVEHGLYFPQRNKIIAKKNEWECKSISIGSSVDLGKKFEILVIQLDSLGIRKLNNYYAQLESSGMFKLPSCIIYEKTMIKRGIKQRGTK